MPERGSGWDCSAAVPREDHAGRGLSLSKLPLLRNSVNDLNQDHGRPGNLEGGSGVLRGVSNPDTTTSASGFLDWLTRFLGLGGPQPVPVPVRQPRR